MNTRTGITPYDAPEEMKELLERLRLQGEISEQIHLMMVDTPETPVLDYEKGVGLVQFKDAQQVFKITVIEKPERHNLVPMLHSIAGAIIHAKKWKPVEVAYGMLPKAGGYPPHVWGLFVRCEDAPHAN